MAEYDFFEVEQQYGLINDTAWMITRQQFTYTAASGKKSSSGTTVATYTNFELNKQFIVRNSDLESRIILYVIICEFKVHIL